MGRIEDIVDRHANVALAAGKLESITVDGNSLNAFELGIVREHAPEIIKETASLRSKLPTEKASELGLRALWQGLIDLRAAVHSQEREKAEAKRKREAEEADIASKNQWKAVLARWQQKIDENPSAFSIEYLPAIAMSDSDYAEFQKRLVQRPDVVEHHGGWAFLIRKRRADKPWNAIIAEVIVAMRTHADWQITQRVVERNQASYQESPSEFVDGSD